MKRNVSGVAIAIVLAVLLGSVVSAQKTGGYREIDKADEGAVGAAEFAVKDQSEKKEMTYKLVSVEKAETQVVAGINYRLCLKVGYHKQDDDTDTTEFVRVVVYRNLHREYSLTSWTEEECGKDGEPGFASKFFFIHTGLEPGGQRVPKSQGTVSTVSVRTEG